MRKPTILIAIVLLLPAAAAAKTPTVEECLKTLELNVAVRKQLDRVEGAKRDLYVRVALMPIEEQHAQIEGIEKKHEEFKARVQEVRMNALAKLWPVPDGASREVTWNILERASQRCELHYGANSQMDNRPNSPATSPLAR